MANADIALKISFYKTRSPPPVNGHYLTSFIRAVMEAPENWSSFTFNRPFPNIFKSHQSFTSEQLRELGELTKGLSVPNLSRLAIFYPRTILSVQLHYDTNLLDHLHYYATWSTPALRSMIVHNVVPIPFSGTSTITSLTIILPFSLYDGGGGGVSTLDVKALVSFLSVCPALVDLALGVGGANHATTPVLPNHRVEMPCVNKLDLGLSNCHASPLKALFDAVRFPHVTTMRLFIKSFAAPDMHFSDIFDAVLPDADAFPKLADMNLVVSADDISIPFSTMPNLMSFELKTMSTGVQYIPDGIALPPIRTLVLRDCYRLEKEWLSQFLRQLKVQGNLDLLRVSIICCKSSRPMNNFGVEGPLSKEDIHWFVK